MRTLVAVLCLVPALAAAQPAPDTRQLEEQVKKEPKNGLAWMRLAAARQKAKDLDGAADAYRKAIDLKFGVPVATYNLATVYALKGDRDRAFASLDAAGKAGFARIDDARNDPDLASLRGDPRWSETLVRMDEAAHPCRANPRNRELDFWVGEWEVRAPQGHLLGSSSVQNVIEGCVIFENWTGNLGHVGKSFNFYDGQRDAWRQVWVDDGGNVVDYTGHARDGAMFYEAEVTGKDGKRAKQRMSFTPLPDGRVRQFWEQSDDGGKTWSSLFEGLYARKK